MMATCYRLQSKLDLYLLGLHTPLLVAVQLVRRTRISIVPDDGALGATRRLTVGETRIQPRYIVCTSYTSPASSDFNVQLVRRTRTTLVPDDGDLGLTHTGSLGFSRLQPDSA